MPLLLLIAALAGTALFAVWLAGRQWVRHSRWEMRNAAAKAERARLAREMHDSLSKTLDALALGAAALPSTLDEPDQAARLAHTLREGSLMAARDARALIEGLRKHPADAPLAELLNAACHEWSVATGVPVRLRVTSVPVHASLIPDLVEIVREALRNVAVHAGARDVEVTLEHGREIVLSIADNGRGVPPGSGPPPGRYGLLGMAERARLAGGRLDLTARDGGGTAVTVVFPAHRPQKPNVAQLLVAGAAILILGGALLAFWDEPSGYSTTQPSASTSPSAAPPSASPSPVGSPAASPSAQRSPSRALPPSPSAKASDIPQPGPCLVRYVIREQWDNGFTADLTITNLATSAVDGWTLVFSFAQAQKLLSAWDAMAAQNGQTVTVSDGGRKTVIPAGQSISFGLQGTWAQSNPVPPAFTLNGMSCQKG